MERTGLRWATLPFSLDCCGFKTFPARRLSQAKLWPRVLALLGRAWRGRRTSWVLGPGTVQPPELEGFPRTGCACMYCAGCIHMDTHVPLPWHFGTLLKWHFCVKVCCMIRTHSSLVATPRTVLTLVQLITGFKAMAPIAPNSSRISCEHDLCSLKQISFLASFGLPEDPRSFLQSRL